MNPMNATNPTNPINSMNATNPNNATNPINATNSNTKEDIFNILRLLSSDEDLTQRDASMRLGFSLGKTNYLLKSLIKKDLIKIKNLISEGNKAKKMKYFLTKKGLKEKINLTYHFLRRKESEYNSIKNEWNILVNEEQEQKRDESRQVEKVL